MAHYKSRKHPKLTLARKARPNGFALIATLSMLVLLTLIAVAMLSLSTISLRSSTIESAETRAKTNARMALQMAIDRLQSELGPDQRVSANGAILESPSNTAAHRHWTGVWNAWLAGPDSDNPSNPSAPSDHQTIVTSNDAVRDGMHPSYQPNRRDHFRTWLVSGNPDALNDLETALNGGSLNLDPSLMPNLDHNAIYLVDEGTLGNLNDSGNLNRPSDRVMAPLVEIKNENGPYPQGRCAWWVGDESQKARLMADAYESGSSLTRADRIFRQQAPGSTGTKTIKGLENIANEDQLSTTPSLKTVDLISLDPPRAEGAAIPSQQNFHNISNWSMGILADVREGGLKRDLSTLLERNIDPTEIGDPYMLYKFDTKDQWARSFSTLPDTPQECVPIQDLAAFYQLYDSTRKGGILYNSSALPNSLQTNTPDYGTTANYMTKFQREYTSLYRNPVPVKIQFLLSLTVDPITDTDRADAANIYIPASDTQKLRIAVLPAVTMWNPYNVPLVMQSGAMAQQLVVKPPSFYIRINKTRSDGSTFGTNLNMTYAAAGSSVSDGRAEPRADLIRLNFARTAPITFQPGEVKVFSMPYTSSGGIYVSVNAMNNTLTEPKNMIDATQGWNPDGYFTFMNSSVGRSFSVMNPSDTRHSNVIRDGGVNRWCLSLASTDTLTINIGAENTTGGQATQPSRSVSPKGAALCFYIGQRNFTAGGYNYLNLRYNGLTSRFGSLANIPTAFNNQLLANGMPGMQPIVPLEPILVSNIEAAKSSGETIPFMQMALTAGCETHETSNGGLAAGRKFPSRPFLHSSPFQTSFIDQNSIASGYNHGWNWWLDEMNSVLEALVQESQAGNGFFGGGYSSENGATHVVQQELPVTPPISIAALSHARIGGFTLANEAPVAQGKTGTSQMEGYGPNTDNGGVDNPTNTLGFQRVSANGQGGLFPHVLQAIGNSYANPNLEADMAFDTNWSCTYDQDDGARKVTFADHSYLANKALWDEFFFSSITPQKSTTDIFDGVNRTAKEVAQAFLFNNEPLPNRRMAPYTTNLDNDRFEEIFAQPNLFSDGLADKIAGHLMINGPFNINSTSVEAWKIIFSSLKGKPMAYYESGNSLQQSTTTDGVTVTMGSLPNGQPAATNDTASPGEPSQWKGMRTISDDEIDALAQAMVREVRKRGPFLSLSDFVNRRLDPSNTDGMALKGALQAALDYDGSGNLGPEVTINKEFRNAARRLDSETGGMGYAFADAAKGPIAYGSAAYVDQADILRQLAAQLTPRGDTFVVRAYGDAVDGAGNIVARAWCEAVVQRTPEYIDNADDCHLKTSSLSSAANQRFGRRLEIMSFRWLHSSEI